MCARHPQVHYSSPCRTFVAKRKTATIKTSANNHKTKKKLTQHQNDSLRRTPVRTPMIESQIGENLFLHIALPHVPHVCGGYFLPLYLYSEPVSGSIEQQKRDESRRSVWGEGSTKERKTKRLERMLRIPAVRASRPQACRYLDLVRDLGSIE